jgi:hypothetical protein
MSCLSSNEIREALNAMRLALFALIVVTLAGAAEPSIGATPAAVSSYCFDRELDDGRPRPICVGLQTYSADVCSAIARDAQMFDLPPAYFARLIWQESRFNPNVVSRAGAEGIAQFMPATGRNQGLVNAYNPAEALWRSARYLSTLRQKFGNLGLAAAAYNGGENRVARFIGGIGYLAAETLDYVEIITATPVTDWLVGEVTASDYALAKDKPFHSACVALAETRTLEEFTPPDAVVQPWGIQLAQFFSRNTARRAFERIQSRYAEVLGDEALMLVAKRNPNFGRALRFTVEVGRESRAEARQLCAKLAKAGGSCLVVRNR